MAYDEGLAQRIREAIDELPPGERERSSEKKMFGGLCFLLGGNMAAGIVGDELMVRVGPDAYEDALSQPHAREMTFTGRAMRGMVYVGVDGFESDGDLRRWLAQGIAFASALPDKGGSAPSGPSGRGDSRDEKKRKKTKKKATTKKRPARSSR